MKPPNAFRTLCRYFLYFSIFSVLRFNLACSFLSSSFSFFIITIYFSASSLYAISFLWRYSALFFFCSFSWRYLQKSISSVYMVMSFSRRDSSCFLNTSSFLNLFFWFYLLIKLLLHKLILLSFKLFVDFVHFSTLL
jgi:hypothetical protein